MRQLIRTYSITGAHQITVTGYTFTKQDIRLVINETLASNATTDAELIASVLVSSTKKDNVTNVLNGVITLDSSTAILTNGDDLTIEIDIDNIAKEANATANKNAIINAINNIDLSTVAKESAATANKEAIIAAINSAEPDLSSVAKETSVKDGNDTTIGMLKDQTNGLAAIKSAIPTVANIQNGLAQETSVKDGNDTAVSVGKEVRSEVGTGSDTAAETGTLSAVLKWTKNKVKDIYTAVTGITGYALQGSDSTKSITTLDADLGDVASALEYMEQGGMPQIAQIAKQGSNANADISTIQALIGYTISEIDGV